MSDGRRAALELAGAHRPPHPLGGQRRHADPDRARARRPRGRARRPGAHRPRHRRRLGRGRPRPRTTPGSGWCAAWRSAPTTAAEGVHLLAYLPDPTHAGPRRRARPDPRGPRLAGPRHDRGAATASASTSPSTTSWPRCPAGRTSPTPWCGSGVVGHARRGVRDVPRPRAGPAYVDRYAAPLETMIGLVTDAGGVSVVAHPWGRGSREVLPRRRARAPARPSAWPASRSTTRTTRSPTCAPSCAAIARDLDLVVTGSSDHHGLGKTDHALGCHTTAPEEYERLLDRAEAAGAAAGRAPGPAWRP